MWFASDNSAGAMAVGWASKQHRDGVTGNGFASSARIRWTAPFSESEKSDFQSESHYHKAQSRCP